MPGAEADKPAEASEAPPVAAAVSAPPVIGTEWGGGGCAATADLLPPAVALATRLRLMWVAFGVP